jgi:hypothetical protein
VAGHTGAFDALFHDHNEPFADWAGNAEAWFYGNMAVVQSNSTRANYYWEIYAIMVIFYNSLSWNSCSKCI